jgi:hypothetical protein
MTRHPRRGAAREPRLLIRNLLTTRRLAPTGFSGGTTVLTEELVESAEFISAVDPGPIFASLRILMAMQRTKSLSTKLTETEYAQVQAQARTQTVSEWARAVLLKTLQPDPIALVVVAEMLATRTILLNLHAAAVSGETPTPETVQRLIDRADRDKWSKAQARLEIAKSATPP